MDEEQSGTSESEVEETKGLWKLVMSSGVLASMCCLPSVVLVMFGLASVSTAAALSDTLYWGPFRPILYGFTLIFIGVGLTFHFRSQGICTLDEAKQQRTRIINTGMVVLLASLITYLELLGIAVGLPWEDDALWN